MAQIIGFSGAWQAIQQRFHALDMMIEQPQDLPSLLEHHKTHHDQWMELKRNEIACSVGSRNQKIADLQSQTEIFRKLVRWFSIQFEKWQIRKLERSEKAYEDYLLRQISEVDRTLNSPEPAGAIAELKVIECLSKLPDFYAVINDLTVRAPGFMRYKGRPVQSAQIDHVVVGPAGVFVIETKCWSKEFVDGGNYHHPFDQVGKASLLMHVLLKKNFRNIKTRSVIASDGYLPQKPKDSYAAVKRIDQLTGYITSFDPLLTHDEVKQVVTHLNK